MACDAVLSIRIVPPTEPNVPYVSVCEPVPRGQRKLCGIAGIPVPRPTNPIPEQVLEVQLAVFPSDAAPEVDGKRQCPIVQFGVDGLPVTQVCSSTEPSESCQGRPAVGGRAFYHPGDEETLITLGCTELELINGEQCTGTDTSVIAAVNDFESPGLDSVTASRLFVSIGEPVPSSATSYSLDSSDTYPLPLDPAAGLPTWSAILTDLGFDLSYCIEVLEDAPLATRTLTCRALPFTYPERIDALGTRLKPELLATILKAANLTAFPSRGLVVGIVLNQSFGPVSGAIVTSPCETTDPNCKIKYLSQDKLSFNETATGSSGIWISEDAPYGSIFNRKGQDVPTVFGGLVDNKVTIVVIQEPGSGGM
jgi:hypothetical protein